MGRLYVFGSRVRGDHRPDSDLDVFVQPPQGGMSNGCFAWWRKPPEERFAALREGVRPIALHLAHSGDDPARQWVLDPDRVTLRIGKVVCVWTLPKPS